MIAVLVLREQLAVGNASTAQIVFAEDTYTFDTGATTFTATGGDNFDLTKGATTTLLQLEQISALLLVR